MEIKKSWCEWLASGDTGVSSETMFSAITGIPVKNYGTPSDLSDVGRCIRMLKKLPELRPLIGMVSEKHKGWMPFIDCWKELEREYERCLIWESTPFEEQKKMKRQKYFIVPNNSFWKTMQELTCASYYLSGMRMQNCKNSWRNKPAESF